MKKTLFIGFCCLLYALRSLAQAGNDSILPPKDSTAAVVKKHLVHKSKDSLPGRKDSSLLPKKGSAALHPDSGRLRETLLKDSVKMPPAVPKPTRAKEKEPADPGTTSAAARVDTQGPPPLIPPAPARAGRATNHETLSQKILEQHPYYRFGRAPVVLPEEARRNPPSKDALFYLFTGLLLYFGIIRLVFYKYLQNLFSLFFRVSLRQQQIREQVLQTPLPSLLLNLLFIATGGLYLAFLAIIYKMTPVKSMWLLWGYGAAILAIIYLGKFFFLKIAGWMFRVRTAADTYIFIVFLVNKILGIFLLPVVIAMAFVNRPALPVILTISYVMIFLFLLYRLTISYRPIRNEIKVSQFHFFLYLCAFEIAPLLLIYKVLLSFVESF